MTALDDGAIDHRQTIAALGRELDQRTTERDEAFGQQAATSEILNVISRSPTDIRAGVRGHRRARRKHCARPNFSAVARFDDGLLHLVAVQSRRWRRQRRLQPLPATARPAFRHGACLCRCAAGAHRGRAGGLDNDFPHAGSAQSVAKLPVISRGTDFRDGRSISVIGCGWARSGPSPPPKSRSSRPSPTRPHRRRGTSVCSTSWRPRPRPRRGVGAADRDRRRIAGHQLVARRSRAGVRRDPGKGAHPVRRDARELVSVRRRAFSCSRVTRLPGRPRAAAAPRGHPLRHDPAARITASAGFTSPI